MVSAGRDQAVTKTLSLTARKTKALRGTQRWEEGEMSRLWGPQPLQVPAQVSHAQCEQTPVPRSHCPTYVSQGCCNEVPQTGWPKQQQLTTSQF